LPRQLNDALDRLAAAPKRDKKMEVLRPVIQQMNASQLKWLCRIILKGVHDNVAAVPADVASCVLTLSHASLQQSR
jgi:hypothetical protein